MAEVSPVFQVTKGAIKAYTQAQLKSNRGGSFRTLAGEKVFRDRYGPLDELGLPAIMIYAIDETSEVLDNTQDRRHLKLQIECWAMGSDADVQLDVLSDSVINWARNDEYLGGPEDGLVEWFRYTHGQLFYDERRHASALAWVLDFDCRYLWQSVPDPCVSDMADFDSAVVTTSWAAPGEIPETPFEPPLSTDTILIPQT